jgi:acyl transferase domain-containing protein
MRDPAGQPYGGRGTVFLFPGQGSYDGALLCELRGSYPETAPWFAAADAAARRWLGEPFLPLAAASPPAAERPAPAGASPERQAPAPDPPDIEQLGIYLGGAATARLLMERGARPALLAGHSFGELAALGAAEVFDLAAGFDIVCRRVLALRAAAPAGTMAALSCGAAQAREMLRAGDADGIEIAVLNHPRQTVVSGPRRELEELAAAAAARGISLTYLKSRYPFHSSHLAGAVEGFAAALRECEWRPPRLPVYLAMERRLLEPGLDLPALLASQLTRRLDFAAAVHGMHDAGYRRFLEVGSGEMVGKLVRKNLAAAGGRVMVQVVAPAGGRLAEGIERAVGLAASGWEESAPAGTSGVGAGAGDVAARDEADGAPAPLAGVSLQELALLLREAAERIARAATMLHPIAATGSGLQPFEPCPEMPIAIVGMGCVLPGAGNPEEFWRNLLDGMSGIVDLAEVDPLLGRDFVAGRSGGEIEVVSDKTYTLLNGAIRAVPYDSRRLAGAYDEDTFAALTRGQRLLATALG